MNRIFMCSNNLKMIFQIGGFLLLLFLAKIYFRGGQCLVPYSKLNEKIAVVTGGNSGVGKQTAKDLLRRGCYVIIAGRNSKKSEKVVEELKRETGSEKIESYALELSSKESIEEFVSNIKHDKIDFLINNAGIMDVPKLILSEEGNEMHYAVNHLGHFYLTHLLLPKLLKSEFFRIISLSSMAQFREYGFLFKVGLNFDDMNFSNHPYSKGLAYSRSKIYTIMFAKALAQKLKGKNGLAVSVHPGVVRSDIGRSMDLSIKIGKALIYPIYYIMTKTCFEGAQTTLHTLYTSPDKLKNGGYYADCQLAKQSQVITKENIDKLWQLSERDLKISFKI